MSEITLYKCDRCSNVVEKPCRIVLLTNTGNASSLDLCVSCFNSLQKFLWQDYRIEPEE